MKAIALFAFLAMAVMVYSENHANYLDDDCPLENDVNATLLPNRANCSAYFVCNWGEKIPMECPEGLEFNAELSVCDWPEDANCTEISE